MNPNATNNEWSQFELILRGTLDIDRYVVSML